MLALVEPGPRVTKQIPGSPVIFPWASAIWAAPPSCRQVIKSMSSRIRYSASKTGKKLSPGTQYTVLTPLIRSASTRTCPPVLPLLDEVLIFKVILT